MHGEAAGEGCDSLANVCTIMKFTVSSWQVNKYINEGGGFDGVGLRRLVVSYDEVCGWYFFVVCDKLQLVVKVAAT